jgi:hypothetical protein
MLAIIYDHNASTTSKIKAAEYQEAQYAELDAAKATSALE